MTPTLTAVLDANVLFSARLRSLLMELAMSGLFLVRWSADIHREWMQAVSRERGIPAERLEATRAAMERAIPEGCVTDYEHLIDSFSLPDPDDRHVLAAAVRCGAQLIVTFNDRDFPESVLRPLGIHTRHPDTFIEDIDLFDPGTLLDAARADRAHYRNPALSVEDYVEGLRLAGLPKTAAHLLMFKPMLEESLQ